MTDAVMVDTRLFRPCLPFNHRFLLAPGFHILVRVEPCEGSGDDHGAKNCFFCRVERLNH
jgi:hypothetical protein